MKVRIVPFSAAHISAEYLGWLNDRHLMRFSRQRLRSHTAESSRAYLASFAGTANFFWAIERLQDGRHVGSLTTYVDTHQRTADLGILLGDSGSAGQGHGGEAWGLALAHAFDKLGLRKVTAGAVAPNEAMVRICRKWDMRLEGTRRKQEMLDDGPADVLLFGLLREEWDSGEKR
jgi:[ribosomal protein S5]-alanine N-acetyltransferase